MIGRLFRLIFGEYGNEFDVEQYDNSPAMRRLKEIGGMEEPRVYDFEDVRNTMTDAEKYEAWYDQMIEGDCV